MVVTSPSSDDSLLVERTPSPTAEQTISDDTHTVVETPSPTVEQQCSDATQTVKATGMKRKRKLVNVRVSVINVFPANYVYAHTYSSLLLTMLKTAMRKQQNIKKEIL